MKDDFFNKLKTMLSGSMQLKVKDDSVLNKNKVDEELVNSFMDQILDSAWVEEDLKASCAPSYHLSKNNKSYWLMNITLKTLFNVKSGIEIIPIEPGEKNTVCLIGQTMYSIPNNIIIYSGWN